MLEAEPVEPQLTICEVWPNAALPRACHPPEDPGVVCIYTHYAYRTIYA